MRLKYDQAVDALYITIVESDEPVSRTEEIEPGTLLDLDRFGALRGIELIQPGRVWPMDDIFDRFELTEADIGILRALWSASGYSYAQQTELEVASVA
jgi:uncharacterized protein YuzE